MSNKDTVFGKDLPTTSEMFASAISILAGITPRNPKINELSIEVRRLLENRTLSGLVDGFYKHLGREAISSSGELFADGTLTLMQGENSSRLQAFAGDATTQQWLGWFLIKFGQGEYEYKREHLPALIYFADALEYDHLLTPNFLVTRNDRKELNFFSAIWVLDLITQLRVARMEYHLTPHCEEWSGHFNDNVAERSKREMEKLRTESMKYMVGSTKVETRSGVKRRLLPEFILAIDFLDTLGALGAEQASFTQNSIFTGFTTDDPEIFDGLCKAYQNIGLIEEEIPVSENPHIFSCGEKANLAKLNTKQLAAFNKSISHLGDDDQEFIRMCVLGNAIVFFERKDMTISCLAITPALRRDILANIVNGSYVSLRGTDVVEGVYVTNRAGKEFPLPGHPLSMRPLFNHDFWPFVISKGDTASISTPRNVEVASPQFLLPALFPDTAYQQQCLTQTCNSLTLAAPHFNRVRAGSDRDSLVLGLAGLRRLSVGLRGDIVHSVLNPNHNTLAGIFSSLLPPDYSDGMNSVTLGNDSWGELSQRAEEFRNQVLEIASLPTQILGFIGDLQGLIEELSDRLLGTGTDIPLARLQEIALLLSEPGDQNREATNSPESITVIIEEAKRIVREQLSNSAESNAPTDQAIALPNNQENLGATGQRIIEKLEEIHRSLLQLKRDQQQPHIVIRVPDGLHSTSSGGRGTYAPTPPTIQECLDRARAVYNEMGISVEAIAGYVECFAGRSTMPHSRTAVILSRNTSSSVSLPEAQFLALISEQIVNGDIQVVQGRSGIRMLLPTERVLGAATKALETEDGLFLFRSNGVPGLSLQRDTLGAAVVNTASRLNLNTYLRLFAPNQPAVVPTQSPMP